MYYRIMIKFCGSFFENFVEIFSRIRINVWVRLFHELRIRMYTRSVPRTSLAVTDAYFQG